MGATISKARLQERDDLGPTQTRSAPIERPTSDTAAAARRFIRATGLKLSQEDPVDLTLLLEIDEALRDAWLAAVNGQRQHGWSDREIGEVLGVTHQAVQQRWPRAKLTQPRISESDYGTRRRCAPVHAGAGDPQRQGGGAQARYFKGQAPNA